MRDTEKEKAAKIVIRGREDVRAGGGGAGGGRADHPNIKGWEEEDMLCRRNGRVVCM